MYLKAENVAKMLDGKLHPAQVGVDVELDFVVGAKQENGVFILEANKTYQFAIKCSTKFGSQVLTMNLVHRSSLTRIGARIKPNNFSNINSKSRFELETFAPMKLESGCRIGQIVVHDLPSLTDVTFHKAVKAYKIQGGTIINDKTNIDPYVEYTELLEPGLYSIAFDGSCDFKSNEVGFGRVVAKDYNINTAVFDPGYKTNELSAVVSIVNKIDLSEISLTMAIFPSQDCQLYNGQFQQKDATGK